MLTGCSSSFSPFTQEQRGLVPLLNVEPSPMDGLQFTRSWIRQRRVYLGFAGTDRRSYVLTLADVQIEPGEEQIAIATIERVRGYPWQIGAADPVTNDAGEIQVRVYFDTGLATCDLATNIKDSILDAGQ